MNQPKRKSKITRKLSVTEIQVKHSIAGLKRIDKAGQHIDRALLEKDLTPQDLNDLARATVESSQGESEILYAHLTHGLPSGFEIVNGIPADSKDLAEARRRYAINGLRREFALQSKVDALWDRNNLTPSEIAKLTETQGGILRRSRQFLFAAGKYCNPEEILSLALLGEEHGEQSLKPQPSKPKS
jgi:hypothetical protein